MKTLILTSLSWIVACFLWAGSLQASTPSLIEKHEGNIVLRDGDFSLTFAGGESFRFVAMERGGVQWLPEGGMTGILWKLTLKGPDGVNPQPTPLNGVYEGVKIKEDLPDKATLVFTWKMRLSKDVYYPVRVFVSLKKDTGLATWGIETDVPAGWKITQVDFPRLSVKRSEQARVVLPYGWGAEYPLSGNASYVVEYPSCRGAMQMLCMQQENMTLYYATHDSDASVKRLRVGSAGNTAVLSSDVVTSESWTPEAGGTFRLPWEVSVGLCPGGWEQAVVQWYKPFTRTTVWGKKSLASRNLPQWVQHADLWLRPHYVTEETRTALLEGLKYFGPETACHWYQWHQIEYDVDYPEYFPPRDGFVSMVEEVHRMGAHVVPYINGRLWDPASESYRRLNGKEASCRKEDGSLYTEIYGSMVPNTITCPASPIWRKILEELAGRIQGELKTDGLYIDQIGAAMGVPCWAPGHAHAPGGGDFWHYSYRSLLEKIRAGLRPGNILVTEENAECFIDLFDVMLIVNSPQSIYCRLVPLFPLVYSDRVVVNGFLYYPKTERVDGLTFRLKNTLGLLWGTQLGWVEPQRIMAPEAKTSAEFLRTLVTFRKTLHGLIYGGTFVSEFIPGGDNPVVDVEGMGRYAVVSGALWQSPEGDQSLLLVNMDTRPHTIELPGKEQRTIGALSCMEIKRGKAKSPHRMR